MGKGTFVQGVKQVEPLRDHPSGKTLPRHVLFSLSRTNTGHDTGTPPGAVGLTIGGLLTLLAGAVITSMNQIWFTG